MHKSVPNHFILAFEAFATLTAWAVFHRAVVRSILRVHISVRAMWGQPSSTSTLESRHT